MMNSRGRDPTRRNRNLGTAKQGHGQNNRDTIPRTWQDTLYDWQRPSEATVVNRHVWGRNMPFRVERTRKDCFHACTVDDIATMLNLLPKRHINNFREIDGIRGIVLRQPTRKEQALSSVWGRMAYWSQGRDNTGPIIIIEAASYPLVLHRGSRFNPAEQREYDRLVAAANRVEKKRRGHDLHFDIEGVRRIQLYKTVPHEVGHWADMYEKVELPGLDDHDRWEKAHERYFQRPVAELEEFAHRYADEAEASLREAGSVPFDRKLDVGALIAEGLHVDDFVPPEGMD